ncbi:TPA: hypothetical protein ACWMH2_000194 [Proteus mirabilis]|nr:hypothetical protein [Proteus mirabilis]MBI6533201.1 hypothetical protein [Proteus mirabilis]HCU0229317.1 hypothetical protein [Proteus mirabilis]HEK1164302.1 hypothetical protein [Proteus mirabilis]
MNKSALFTSAHKIAKSTVSVVGDYRIAFMLALRSLYHTVESTTSKLIKLGCSVWENYGKRRVYINYDKLEAVFGLEIGFYNTGNISYAYMHGEKISNTSAYKLLSVKPYFDCVTNSWVHHEDLSPII